MFCLNIKGFLKFIVGEIIIVTSPLIYIYIYIYIGPSPRRRAAPGRPSPRRRAPGRTPRPPRPPRDSSPSGDWNCRKSDGMGFVQGMAWNGRHWVFHGIAGNGMELQELGGATCLTLLV